MEALFVFFFAFCSKRPSTMRSARRRTPRMSDRRRQTPDVGFADMLSQTERQAAVSSIRLVRLFLHFRSTRTECRLVNKNICEQEKRRNQVTDDRRDNKCGEPPLLLLHRDD